MRVPERRLRYVAIIAAVVLAVGVGAVLAGAGHSSTTGLPKPVDAIECATSEQVLFHVHSHLAVVVDGRPLRIPGGIGIAPPRSVASTAEGPFVVNGACFYWLHTHARDGIVHIESPVQRRFTLGDFFDIWRQPLERDRVAGVHGLVTAYVDGRPFAGNPRAIPLGPHRVIQLDVGRRTSPRAFAFPPGL